MSRKPSASHCVQKFPPDLYKPESSRLSWGLNRVVTVTVNGSVPFETPRCSDATVIRVSSAFGVSVYASRDNAAPSTATSSSSTNDSRPSRTSAEPLVPALGAYAHVAVTVA